MNTVQVLGTLCEFRRTEIPAPFISHSLLFLQVRKDSKKSKKLENTFYEDTVDPAHQTYDDVYESSRQKSRPSRYKLSPQNTYENVKVLNLVGSLKRKLKTGKIRHNNFLEEADRQVRYKKDSDNAHDVDKPVPAARGSMKKESRNRVGAVKPARGAKPNNNNVEPGRLKNRTPSEAEFVENDLYEDRSFQTSPGQSFVHSSGFM